MRSADPYEDFDRYDKECADDEKKYPVCDICGKRITDDYYYTIGNITFHLGCADKHSTDNYIGGIYD